MLSKTEHLATSTRRYFLGHAGLGVGGMALASLMQQPSLARQDSGSQDSVTGRLKDPKAKSVIYLHMAGSPSQIDLFENKPALAKYHGEACPQEYLEGKRFAFIKGVPKMLGPLFDYQKRGESGQWISELLPHFSKVVDKTCVIRSVNTDQFNHSPAQLLLHTGQPRLGYPSMGSWVTYGLGSENKNLPGFVVLVSGGKTPSAGKSLWGSGFLPTVYQGVQCRTEGDPVLYLSNPEGITRKTRRHTLDAINDWNRERFHQVGDVETLTRISQYELAYRMQTAVPEVMDLAKENQETLELYGAMPGFQSAAEKADDPRPLYKGDETLPIKCRQIDRAISGLLVDLERRGLLDSTLVVWGGEFGRTPMMQNNVRSDLRKGFIGRDHHPHAYTMWMAGGGIQPGLAYGQTDEIGYYIAENPVNVRDLQATILHQIGLDPHRFSFPFQGLDNRLIGPTDEGRVLHDILA